MCTIKHLLGRLCPYIVTRRPGGITTVKHLNHLTNCCSGLSMAAGSVRVLLAGNQLQAIASQACYSAHTAEPAACHSSIHESVVTT